MRGARSARRVNRSFIPCCQNRKAGGNRPAGLTSGGKRMVTHLLLLLLIVVILVRKVKVTIETL
jgi:hypothetical protein